MRLPQVSSKPRSSPAHRRGLLGEDDAVGLELLVLGYGVVDRERCQRDAIFNERLR